MTLVEILVALSIVASLTVFIVSRLGDTEASNLRRTSAQLVRMIKQSYIQAATSSVYYRITFDLSEEPQQFLPSSSYTPYYIVKTDDEIEAIRLKNEERLDEDEAVSSSVGTGDFAELEDDLVEITYVPENIKIMDIQTESQEAPVTEGAVQLYFFPKGYTEFAVIHLSTESETGFMTLIVSPLTGEVEVVPEYIEYDDAKERE